MAKVTRRTSPKATRQFLVTLTLPPGVTVEEARIYVEEAVAVWCGGKDPESPIFDLDGKSVRVKSVSRRRIVK